MAALGSQSGISKSQVSRICQEIDRQVPAFLARPLESSGYAYVYLDATYLKGRLGKALQVCSRAVVVALGVNEDGRRELLGLKVGDSETESFWAEFNRCAEGKAYAQLKERGLSAVRLVISDAHAGLTKAIRRQLQESVWQRCRVHHRLAADFAYARNLLQCVPKAHQGMVTAALRSVFAQVPGINYIGGRLPNRRRTPRKPQRKSGHAGVIWPPRWWSASPRQPHCRRSRPEAIA